MYFVNKNIAEICFLPCYVSISVFYFYITNYHKIRGLKQHPFMISKSWRTEEQQVQPQLSCFKPSQAEIRCYFLLVDPSREFYTLPSKATCSFFLLSRLLTHNGDLKHATLCLFFSLTKHHRSALFFSTAAYYFSVLRCAIY